LLGVISDLDIKSLLEGNQIFEEFKGTLTELYVLQQLSAKKRSAEIDLILRSEMYVVPLEVKALSKILMDFQKRNWFRFF